MKQCSIATVAAADDKQKKRSMASAAARAINASPPAWKCIGATATALGLSFVAYEITPKYSKPITCNPAWQTASWMRSWNKEREAGDPVILNPFRLACAAFALSWTRKAIEMSILSRNGNFKGGLKSHPVP